MLLQSFKNTGRRALSGLSGKLSRLGRAHEIEESTSAILAPLLEDRALRLQVERAVTAGAARLQSWGAAGQRHLTGASADLSATMAIAAVAGATLDGRSREELRAFYLGWQRDALTDHQASTSRRSAPSLAELIERIEGRAPRWLKRPGARARASALALLREAINQGARRRRRTPPSAQESDLLRLACEPAGSGRDDEAIAELLLTVLERVQRFAQRACGALLEQWSSAPESVHPLLEEQDWVFGDQGDITYETLRPLEQLRTMLRAHAPIPADAIEERVGEPLALALLSLVLQRLELLTAPPEMLLFRQRGLNHDTD